MFGIVPRRSTCWQNLHDAADHTAIIEARFARVSVGRCGLIFENCAFVSQNCSRLIYASFSEAVNHATTPVPTLLWGPDPKNSGADSAIYAIFGCCLFRLRIA